MKTTSYLTIVTLDNAYLSIIQEFHAINYLINQSFKYYNTNQQFYTTESTIVFSCNCAIYIDFIVISESNRKYKTLFE